LLIFFTLFHHLFGVVFLFDVIVSLEAIITWSKWSKENGVGQVLFFHNLLSLLLLFELGFDCCLSFFQLSDMADVSSGEFGLEIEVHFVNTHF